MSLTMTPPAPVNGVAPPVPALGAGLPPPVMSPRMPGAEPTEAASREPENAHKAQLSRWARMTNIANDDDVSDQLEPLAARVVRDFEIDDRSRNDWKEKYRKWLDFALQIADKKTYPWPEACYSLDTDILTDEGWRPVGDVHVGDKVLSRGPDRKASYCAVTKTFRHQATSLVHFEGKSIDLLVTPNHKMLVESKHGRRKKQHFIEAERFLSERLAWRYVPLTSESEGEEPEQIHGIPARAYLRFLGWYISEGWRFTGRNVHTLVSGEVRDYGVSSSSYGIAQSQTANPAKYRQLQADIEACGFTWSSIPQGFIVHARSMPQGVKVDLSMLGTAEMKHIPRGVFAYSASYLREILSTLVAGDGSIRVRPRKQDSWSYGTVSAQLADDLQELCQRIGQRATITARAAAIGGVINGRQIVGEQICYCIQINRKERIQIAKMDRSLVYQPQEVACVEVEPHHTVYVRRNGKALWCGNSNIIYPLMTTAAVQFAARAYPAIIRDRNVVKGSVVGSDTGTPAVDPTTGYPIPAVNGPMWKIEPGAKQIRADLIGRHMSWQLLDEQEEWEPQTDRLLIVLPIVGLMYRKSYFAPDLGRNVSETVTAMDLCVNYYAKSFETAPRKTEMIRLYPWEIEEKIRAGLFLEYGDGSAAYGHDQMGSDQERGGHSEQDDEDAPTTFLEQHRRYDLDGDGYAEPYIVTVARDSGKLARIKAGFEDDGIQWKRDGTVQKVTAVEYYTKYGFIPNPDSNVYDLGFGHLLFPINEAVNTTLNQMFDAGHLQIVGGGFVSSSLSINTGALRFQMGEYKPVQVMGGDLRGAVLPLEFPGPNAILMQLLVFLVEAAEKVASVKDVMTGEMPAENTPGIAMLAAIEQGLNVFSAIYKRVYRSLTYEFRKLYRLNSIYLPGKKTGFGRGGEWQEISREDYLLGAGVEPVSDPRMVTDMQRLGQAQFLAAFKDDPRVNGQAILLDIFRAANISRPERLMAQAPAPDPKMLIKARELDIRQAREQTDLQLRAFHDKAMVVREIAQAELFLAQARKLDNDIQIDWVEQHLQRLRDQVDAFSAVSDAAVQQQQASQPDDSGDTAASG